MWTKPAPCMWRREERGFVLLIERSRGEFGCIDLAGAKRAAMARHTRAS